MLSIADLFSTKILVLFTLILLHTFVVAAEAAGFREMSVDDVDFGVWYPSDTSPSFQRLGPFDVEIAKNAPIRAGKYEIVLFSHGYGGRYYNHHLTAQILADGGFVVVAPQHKADYLIGGRKTTAALDRRYLELSKALDAVIRSPEFRDHVDQKIVHALGYSLGGATILLASGAGYSSQLFKDYCRKNRALDSQFCGGSNNIFGWFSRLVQSFFRHDVNLRPTPDPFRNPPLITGKIVLVAPVFQGIDPTLPLAMSRLTVFALDGDTIAIPKFHARPLFEAISRNKPSDYQTIKGHHYAFIAPFPKWLMQERDIPVAKDPEGFDRLAFLEVLNKKILAAFKSE